MSKYQFRVEDYNEDEVGHGRTFKQFLRENRKQDRAFDDEVRKERKDTKKRNKPARNTDRGQW